MHIDTACKISEVTKVFFVHEGFIKCAIGDLEKC